MQRRDHTCICAPSWEQAREFLQSKGYWIDHVTTGSGVYRMASTSRIEDGVISQIYEDEDYFKALEKNG